MDHDIRLRRDLCSSTELAFAFVRGALDPDGNSDVRFDLIAAFVASGRSADLYTIQEMSDAVVDDNGVIMAAGQACKQDATEPCETFSIKVVAGWEGCDPEVAFTEPCETAEEFNVITNTAIADGVITDA